MYILNDEEHCLNVNFQMFFDQYSVKNGVQINAYEPKPRKIDALGGKVKIEKSGSGATEAGNHQYS